MKKLVLFICLFIFINANSQNYFYSYNSKISIESTDAIVLKNDVNVNNFVVNNNATSAASIVVTNSSGLAVYSSAINVSATTHTLNVQNLVAGQYSLRLVSSTGEVLDTKTLIVQ